MAGEAIGLVHLFTSYFVGREQALVGDNADDQEQKATAPLKTRDGRAPATTELCSRSRRI